MKILGVSAFYHDSAAALVDNGVILSAAQEERFSRIKHDSSFPEKAINYCLSKSNVKLSEVDAVVFYDKPFLKFERILETYLAFAPRGFISFQKSLPVWLKEKLFQKSLLLENLKSIDSNFNDAKLLFSEHHMSHAASAFYPSPFDKAAVLVLDGVGEWSTTSLAIGNGSSLQIEKELRFPHSLGLLYSAFTYYTGFKVNSGEYKLMGLAPYGEPVFYDLILNHLMDLKEDGSFKLNLKYFDYCTHLKMTNRNFDELFGGPARAPHEKITQHHMNLAASIQKVTEEVLIRLTRSIAKETGLENLCLAGGVALNCVANGKIYRDGKFKNIWIQPAAGDAGGAIGAALSAFYLHFNQERLHRPSHLSDGMKGSYLGPEFESADIENRLLSVGAKFERLSDENVISHSAALLSNGKALGWFQGAMEFGPRALGGRSILADPRSPIMQTQLNLKVKFRESFRPFAPSVTSENVKQWFDYESDSPYMLMVANVKDSKCKTMTEEEKKLFGIDKLSIPRSEIPAVTHVDYSARIQTVHRDTNQKYFDLIKQFDKLTGCPVLVNTSFNVRGEPIVATPEDAFRCFMGTDIDALVVGNFLMLKEEQNPSLKLDYKEAFELD